MKIKATKREIVGRKVKTLRNEGLLPASVYGPDRDSLSITIDDKEFKSLYKEIGYNKMADLVIGDTKESSKVLVKEIQRHPIRDEILHVSFYEIDMKKKIIVDIPVIIQGESTAVKNNLGFLVNPIESISVFCLPSNIPGEITVNIDSLENVNDTIAIGAIKLPEGVEWSSSVNEETVVVRVAPPQKEIIEEIPGVLKRYL